MVISVTVTVNLNHTGLPPNFLSHFTARCCYSNMQRRRLRNRESSVVTSVYVICIVLHTFSLKSMFFDVYSAYHPAQDGPVRAPEL